MVPFSMRVIAAELPAHTGKGIEGLDALFALERTCTTVVARLDAGQTEAGTGTGTDADAAAGHDKAEQDARLELWRARHVRVQYAIGNCQLRSSLPPLCNGGHALAGSARWAAPAEGPRGVVAPLSTNHTTKGNHLTHTARVAVLRHRPPPHQGLLAGAQRVWPHPGQGRPEPQALRRHRAHRP